MFTERAQSEQEPRNELSADGWARAQQRERYGGFEEMVRGRATGDRKGMAGPRSPLVWVFRRKSHYNVTVTEWMTMEQAPWSIPQLAPYGSSQSHPLYS